MCLGSAAGAAAGAAGSAITPFAPLVGPLVGLAGSLISGNASAEAQQQQQQAQLYNEAATAIDNTLAAEASNRVLSQYLNQQGANEATNQGYLQPEYAAMQPGAFEASRQGFAAQDAANSSQAIAKLLASSGPQLGLTNTDNGQSAKAIQNATAQRVGVAEQTAKNAANLQSYGQNFANFGLDMADANRNLDRTNAQARAQTAILPTDEQNAALQARHFFPPAQADTSGASMMQGAGNILAGIGGQLSGPLMQGINNGIGSVFNGMNSVTNPTLSTMTPSFNDFSNSYQVGGVNANYQAGG